jgi:hypothetical protein
MEGMVVFGRFYILNASPSGFPSLFRPVFRVHVHACAVVLIFIPVIPLSTAWPGRVHLLIYRDYYISLMPVQ